MCLGSLLIAVAPTYAQAGVLAPALLVAARILQGISLGGEYGSSATYLSEMAGRERRGFWSSFQYVTIIGGQLLALAVLVVLQALLGEAALEAWGWRLAFGGGGALAIVVFFIRRRLDETLSYKNVAAVAGPAAIDRPQPVPRPSARGVPGDGADRRRHRRLLRLHDLSAEIPGQHQRVRPHDGVADHDRRAWP